LSSNSIKISKKSINDDRTLENEVKDWDIQTKNKGSLGRRGDFSSSEPSLGEKPVK
jgi:hypothetical protein